MLIYLSVVALKAWPEKSSTLVIFKVSLIQSCWQEIDKDLSLKISLYEKSRTNLMRH